ncbi:hypothetical protein H5410_002640 [Solanum commersonii]|uniref:Uncharacterized protein n=1 Tax=Solanum commersonii TaxID=4109 RepID=A0A9J6B2T7_SOLCO|nr:hypothetical protein H5410_002640 [Solanum commersonii]
MIIPEKIEKQEEIQKIEIPNFYARKQIIGLATILNELSTNYLRGNSVWSYYAREQTMIYSNSRETREAELLGTNIQTINAQNVMVKIM